MVNRQPFLRPVAETVIAQIAGGGIGLAWMVVAARHFGPELQGGLTLAIAGTNTIVVLGSIGLQHSMPYLAKNVSAPALFASASMVALVLTAVSTVATVLGLKVLAGFALTNMSTAAIGLTAAIVAVSFLNNYFTAFFRTVFAVRTANYTSLIQPFVFLIAIAALAIADIGSLEPLLAAYLGAGLTMFAVGLWILLRTVGFNREYIDTAMAMSLVRYGGRSQAGNIHKEIMYRADLYIVGYMLGAQAAGIYAVALKITEVISRFVDAVGSVLLPKVARMDAVDAHQFTPGVVAVIFWTMVIAAGVVALAADTLIPLLFGADYAGAVGLLRILVLGLAPLAIWKLIANDLIARGYAGSYSLTAVAGSYTMIGMALFLVPRIGSSGAAIGSAAAYFFAAALLLAFYVSSTGVSPVKMFSPNWTQIKNVFLIRSGKPR